MKTKPVTIETGDILNSFNLYFNVGMPSSTCCLLHTLTERVNGATKQFGVGSGDRDGKRMQYLLTPNDDSIPFDDDASEVGNTYDAFLYESRSHRERGRHSPPPIPDVLRALVGRVINVPDLSDYAIEEPEK